MPRWPDKTATVAATPADQALIPGSTAWEQALLGQSQDKVRRAMIYANMDNLVRAREDEGPQARVAELRIAKELARILGIGGPPLSKSKQEEFNVELNEIGRRIWERRKARNGADADAGGGPDDGAAQRAESA